MSVIPLTIAISLGLALAFVGGFLRSRRRGAPNAERDSLLPLADESPGPAGGVEPDHDLVASRD